jgi:regulator of nucleoside diphosphate kinase
MPRPGEQQEDPMAGNAPPRITMTTTDIDRLSDLASAAQNKMPDVAHFLNAEIERATVVEPDEVPADVVTMNSRVRFRDEVTGEEHDVTLVYPEEQSLEQHKMSVLTPVGAALIGLSVGQSIAWHTRLGGEKTLTVLAVERPLRAG